MRNKGKVEVRISYERRVRRGPWIVCIYIDPLDGKCGVDYRYEIPGTFDEKTVRKLTQRRKTAILKQAEKDGHF